MSLALVYQSNNTDGCGLMLGNKHVCLPDDHRKTNTSFGSCTYESGQCTYLIDNFQENYTGEYKFLIYWKEVPNTHKEEIKFCLILNGKLVYCNSVNCMPILGQKFPCSELFLYSVVTDIGCSVLRCYM